MTDNVTRLDAHRRPLTPAQEAAEEIAYALARFDTDNPCPPWCAHVPGHPYRHAHGEEPEARALHRLHYADLADLTPWHLVLRITQDEYAAEDGSGPHHLDRPCVSLYALADHDDETPSGDNLRDLARRLMTAADHLDTFALGPRP